MAPSRLEAVSWRMDGWFCGMVWMFSSRKDSRTPHSQASPFRKQLPHTGRRSLPVAKCE